MKLRNKETGEMGEARLGNREIYVETGDKTYCYVGDIDSFCKEWERVETAEPLIKDEKICKAIRAWAEANDMDEDSVVLFDKCDNSFSTDTSCVEFDDYLETDKLENGEFYAIAELCGEEDEE